MTPAQPSIVAGTSQPFMAMGTYWYGTAVDLTASVTWSSTSTGVAMVDQGMAHGRVVGTTIITATEPLSGLSASTELTVTSAVLSSLSLTPTLPQIALGTSVQVTAMGIFSDSTVHDLTGSVAWNSSNAAVALVNGGLAQSTGVGAATITATDPASATESSTTLTVTPAVLTSIAVTPTGPSVALGTTQQFTATGTYSDSSTQNLTDSLTWSSTSAAVATVSNAPGTEALATSVSVGVTTLTATDPASAIDGSTTLTVTPAVLTSIAVAPTDPSVALGTTQQFTATGTYSDSSTQDLTDSLTWSSASAAVATVSNAGGTEGLATSVSVGITTLTATDPASAINGSTTLTIAPAVLISIAVTPEDMFVPVGASRQLTATGTYSDATTQDLTDSAAWSSTSPAVATVSNAGGSEGLASAVSSGSITLTATDAASGIDGTTTLVVIQDITFRGAASVGSSGGLNLTVPTPTGTLPGDVLVASIAVRPSTATITPPSGWTPLRRIDNAVGNSNSLAVYWRVAVGGEPASHTWVFSTSTGSVGGIAAFYGADPSSAIDAEDGQSTPSSLTHDTPSLTTTRSGTVLVTAHSFSTSVSWTPPGGMAEILEVASLTVPNAAGISLELNYVLQPVAGASGVKSATASAGADTGNAHILALSPGL